jgi:uncharacterized membrane protein
LLATALGSVFVVVGELLRSRDARIAQAVTAAGVAVLYAALFASVVLYELVPRGLGLVLAAALSALSVVLSLRQGPFVALLGLVGGAIAPAIIAQDSNDTMSLFGYLLALIAGVMVVVRQRNWWWLGWCALLAAALWAGLWLRVGYAIDGVPWLAIFLVAIGALFVWITRTAGGSANRGLQQQLLWVALGLTSVLAAVLVGRSDYGAIGWAAFLALGGLVLLQARRFADHRQLFAAAPAVLSLLIFWQWGPFLLLHRAETSRYALTALAIGGIVSLAAYAALWRAPRPGFWAALSVGSALLHFGVVCGVLFHADVGLGWGAIALLLALAFLVGAVPAGLVRARPGMDEAFGVLVVGVIAFVSAAVPLELRREWITMSYALELPVVALLAWRLHLPLLRWLVWLLVATVTIRLVFNPYVLDYDVSANPLLNWVLYGYGVAIASYWLTAQLLKRVTQDEFAATLMLAIQASQLAFGFLLLSLEVRSIFHPEGLGVPRFEVMERGWTSLSWGGMALALIFLQSRRPHPVLLWGGRIIGAIALALIAFGALVWLDRLFATEGFGGGIGGGQVFNGLIVLFGAPALMAAAASLLLQRSGQTTAATVAGIAALVLGFAFFSYEIRHWFNFADGHRVPNTMQDAELYAYSIVWLLFGAALLLGGIVRRSTMLRYASLIVLVLVVGKVFLVDMSGLTGLLRVASFLGLGIGLLALGFLYRRYVFADDRPAAAGG